MEAIVVASLRKGSKPVSEGYTAIRIDRKNPVLGNPFRMKSKLDGAERKEVINDFRALLFREMKREGPMWKEVESLADRVEKGEKLALQCWCAPLPCHGDVVKKAIMFVLKRRNIPPEGQQVFQI